MSESKHAWVPIELVQHHARVHTDVLYTWTIEEAARIRYEALLGRDDPGKLRIIPPPPPAAYGERVMLM